MNPGPRWKPSDAFLDDLPRLLDLACVPGLSVAVVEEAEVAWEGGFGVRNRATGQPMTADTLMEVASLSKPVFAHAALGLWEEGWLDLDRPFAESMPDLGLSGEAARITPRHALSQSTGLVNWRREDVALRPEREPGTAYSYSGEGICLLQRLAERVTGSSLCQLVEGRVFRPFGMTRSDFFWDPAHEENVAQGHDRRGDPKDNYVQLGRDALGYVDFVGKPLREWRWGDMARVIGKALPDHLPLPTYIVPNAAGSLLSTAGDYARFTTTIMARDEARGADLADSTRDTMLSPATHLNDVLAWGLGWGLEHHENRHLAWHWGDNEIFQCFVLVDPERRRSIVVLTNSANGRKLYPRLVADATGGDHAAFLWYQV